MDIEDLPRVLECLRMAEEKNIDLLPLTPQIDMSIFEKYPSEKFPAFVYKSTGNSSFSDRSSGFGILVESLIQYFLINDFPQFVVRNRCDPDFIELCKKPIKEVLPVLLVMSRFSINTEINWSLINKIRRDLKTTFSPYFEKGYLLVLCYEINDSKVVGHPDLLLVRDLIVDDKRVKEVNVIDIKAVAKPKTNASAHYKQISAYTALLANKGATVVSIGLYYPLQKQPYLRIMLPKDWDHTPLLEYLRPYNKVFL